MCRAVIVFFFWGGCAGPVVMAGRCCAAELRETADDLGRFVGNMSKALLVLAGETATLRCEVAYRAGKGEPCPLRFGCACWLAPTEGACGVCYT